ncbi:MAG: hypothetical protein ABFR82_14470 [Nitrospirota bacterium]
MRRNVVITCCLFLLMVLALSGNVISSQHMQSSVWLKTFHKFYGLPDNVTIHQDLDDNFEMTQKALKNNRELIEKLKKDIKRLEQIQLPMDFPVGTIISSMLPYKKFQKAAGALWKPADGRNVSARSRYTKLTGKKTLPDLRGMFLRGLNQFDPLKGPRLDNYRDPEGKGRKAGSLQLNATCLPNESFTATAVSTGEHKHIYSGALTKGVKSGSHEGASSEMSRTGSTGEHDHNVLIDGGGDMETRPNNITVYYYIKIN